jgi:NAD-dependent dihydropyrimidine dehydrogenase PreA subunit
MVILQTGVCNPLPRLKVHSVYCFNHGGSSGPNVLVIDPDEWIDCAVCVQS